MTPGARFGLRLALLTAAVLALFAIVGAALWLGIERGQRAALAAVLQDKLSLLAALALLLPFALGGLLRWWMAAWPQAAVRMAHEVGLLDTPGAGRRVTLGGAAAMRQLGDA